MSAEYMCQNLELSSLFRCSFNLNKTEHQILLMLVKKQKDLSVKEIESLLHLERSTIQKALKLLLEKELITRKQKNISSGGYLFSYASVSKQQIKSKMLDAVRHWHSSVEKMIDSW